MRWLAAGFCLVLGLGCGESTAPPPDLAEPLVGRYAYRSVFDFASWDGRLSVHTVTTDTLTAQWEVEGFLMSEERAPWLPPVPFLPPGYRLIGRLPVDDVVLGSRSVTHAVWRETGSDDLECEVVIRDEGTRVLVLGTCSLVFLGTS